LRRQAEEPVLFLDETNHGDKIYVPLKEHGIEVVRINDVFPRGTLDEEWIPYVAQKGWAIITKDRAQDMTPIELLLLYRNNAKRYLISGGKLKGEEIAKRIISNYKRIRNTFNSQPAPFIFTIYKDRLKLTYSVRKMRDKLIEVVPEEMKK